MTISDGQLDEEISEIYIEEIAAKYISTWEGLTPHLGLYRVQEEAIRRSHPGDYVQQKRSLLYAWKLEKGCGATYRVLIDAAEKSRNQNLADNIRTLLLKAPSSLTTPPQAAHKPSTCCCFKDLGHEAFNTPQRPRLPQKYYSLPHPSRPNLHPSHSFPTFPGPPTPNFSKPLSYRNRGRNRPYKQRSDPELPLGEGLIHRLYRQRRWSNFSTELPPGVKYFLSRQGMVSEFSNQLPPSVGLKHRPFRPRSRSVVSANISEFPPCVGLNHTCSCGAILDIAQAVSQLQGEFVSVLECIATVCKKIAVQDEHFLPRFISMLIALPISNRFRHMTFMDNETQSIKEAKSVSEILASGKHCNLTNFGLLEHVIKVFGDNIARQKMTKYKFCLEDFEKKTTVLQFHKAIMGNKREAPVNRGVIVAKLNKAPSQCTLWEVRCFMNDLKRKASLEEYVGHVLRFTAEVTSVVVTLAMPHYGVVLIKNVVGRQFWVSQNVESVTVDGKQILMTGVHEMEDMTQIGKGEMSSVTAITGSKYAHSKAKVVVDMELLLSPQNDGGDGLAVLSVMEPLPGTVIIEAGIGQGPYATGIGAELVGGKESSDVLCSEDVHTNSEMVVVELLLNSLSQKSVEKLLSLMELSSTTAMQSRNIHSEMVMGTSLLISFPEEWSLTPSKTNRKEPSMDETFGFYGTKELFREEPDLVEPRFDGMKKLFWEEPSLEELYFYGMKELFREEPSIAESYFHGIKDILQQEPTFEDPCHYSMKQLFREEPIFEEPCDYGTKHFFRQEPIMEDPHDYCTKHLFRQEPIMEDPHDYGTKHLFRQEPIFVDPHDYGTKHLFRQEPIMEDPHDYGTKHLFRNEPSMKDPHDYGTKRLFHQEPIFEDLHDYGMKHLFRREPISTDPYFYGTKQLFKESEGQSSEDSSYYGTEELFGVEDSFQREELYSTKSNWTSGTSLETTADSGVSEEWSWSAVSRQLSRSSQPSVTGTCGAKFRRGESSCTFDSGVGEELPGTSRQLSRSSEPSATSAKFRLGSGGGWEPSESAEGGESFLTGGGEGQSKTGGSMVSSGPAKCGEPFHSCGSEAQCKTGGRVSSGPAKGGEPFHSSRSEAQCKTGGKISSGPESGDPGEGGGLSRSSGQEPSGTGETLRTGEPPGTGGGVVPPGTSGGMVPPGTSEGVVSSGTGGSAGSGGVGESSASLEKKPGRTDRTRDRFVLS